MKIKRCCVCGRKPKQVKVFGFYGYFCAHGKRAIADYHYMLSLLLYPSKKKAIEDWNNDPDYMILGGK